LIDEKEYSSGKEKEKEQEQIISMSV